MNKKEKRLSEFKGWIEGFAAYYKISEGKDLSFIAKAAEILNDRYWEYAENYIRPIIREEIENKKIDPSVADPFDETYISRFKIASATELTVVEVQPIVINGEPLKERRVNAEFAWYVGYTILDSFSDETISSDTVVFVQSYKENIPNVDSKKITPILEEHLEWLSNLDQDVQLPIISNAQTWRLFYFCLLALEGKIKPSAGDT
jgi:hypothetical protein